MTDCTGSVMPAAEIASDDDDDDGVVTASTAWLSRPLCCEQSYTRTPTATFIDSTPENLKFNLI